MIYPRSYKVAPTFGSPVERKSDILAFMKAFDPVAIAEGYVRDLKTGKVDKRIVDAEYEVNGLGWYDEDTYNFEHNNLELSPEFRARVLELIG